MRFHEFGFRLLNEAKEVRTPHPEDSVFSGLAAAKDMVNSLYWVIDNPETLTIKWDGIPALIFGYDDQGRFTISDKYMFDKGPEYYGTSPQFWQEYDAGRGKDRGELYQKIANIWNGLKAAVGNSPGFFWGDLLWGQPIPETDGKFVFKPNTVQYSVPVNSDLGKMIKGTNGGIVVHQYYASADSAPVQWNGKGLKSNKEVAIITPSMGMTFSLSAPNKDIAAVNQALSQNANLDEFLGGLSGVAKTALKSYLNKVSTRQTTEPVEQWLQPNISGKQYKELIGDGDGYLIRNKKQLDALFNLYNAIAALKNNLTVQLEKQVQGLEQSVNGAAGGEGFVFNTPSGLVKLVNRGGFSAAHFAKK